MLDKVMWLLWWCHCYYKNHENGLITISSRFLLTSDKIGGDVKFLLGFPTSGQLMGGPSGQNDQKLYEIFKINIFGAK